MRGPRNPWVPEVLEVETLNAGKFGAGTLTSVEAASVVVISVGDFTRVHVHVGPLIWEGVLPSVPAAVLAVHDGINDVVLVAFLEVDVDVLPVVVMTTPDPNAF